MVEGSKKAFQQEEYVRPALIPNTIEQVPRVGDIGAMKLVFALFPDGVSRWIAVKGDERRGYWYSEVAPWKDGDCKAVAGTFSLTGTWRKLDTKVEFKRKALNEWYFEKRPVKGCVVNNEANAWALEPKTKTDPFGL